MATYHIDITPLTDKLQCAMMETSERLMEFRSRLENCDHSETVWLWSDEACDFRPFCRCCLKSLG